MKQLLKSPAKLNIFLKVLSKRPDGYHNILSIADIISIYDLIYMEETKGGIEISDSRGWLPKGEENTIYRAVMRLRDRFQIKRGIKIYVEKNIPIGSGLGGPSSNAATVLKGLAELWGLSLAEGELAAIGREIGADVPLFIYNRSSIMEGIGDRLSPIRLPHMWYLVLYPDVVLRSKDIYEGLKIVLTKGENDIKLKTQFLSAIDVAEILENDLERIAISICPKIRFLKERLADAGAIGMLMSGSGSSVFGIFEDEDGARRASYLFKDIAGRFIAHNLT